MSISLRVDQRATSVLAQEETQTIDRNTTCFSGPSRSRVLKTHLLVWGGPYVNHHTL